jgi:DNA repair photolyase
METLVANRKSSVLGPSTLACLSDAATINVTLGCAHGCAYCYGRAYQCYPGHGKVVLYGNLLALARAELPRKKRRPTCAYFCPSCDPFQPIPAVLDSTYELMQFFLDEGIDVTFLTKGRPPKRFLRLFGCQPRRVSGQVGLTSLDESFLRLAEPGAPSPSERLAGMADLTRLGIPVTLRMDPMWPALTDGDAHLSDLLHAAKSAGVSGVAASYLFLRSKLKKPIFSVLAALGAGAAKCRSMLAEVAPLAIDAKSSKVLALPAAYRKEGYENARTIASRFGLPLRICGCKNRDLTAEACGLARPSAGWATRITEGPSGCANTAP